MRGFAALSLHLGEDTRVVCHTYEERGPILVVATGGVDLTFTYDPHGMTAAREVEIARALVEAARCFLSEVERMASNEPAADAAA